MSVGGRQRAQIAASAISRAALLPAVTVRSRSARHVFATARSNSALSRATPAPLNTVQWRAGELEGHPTPDRLAPNLECPVGAELRPTSPTAPGPPPQARESAGRGYAASASSNTRVQTQRSPPRRPRQPLGSQSGSPLRTPRDINPTGIFAFAFAPPKRTTDVRGQTLYRGSERVRGPRYESVLQQTTTGFRSTTSGADRCTAAQGSSGYTGEQSLHKPPCATAATASMPAQAQRGSTAPACAISAVCKISIRKSPPAVNSSRAAGNRKTPGV